MIVEALKVSESFINGIIREKSIRYMKKYIEINN